MSRVLVIGCGGVASVAIQKCCQADEVFTELCIASRTKEKCDALAEKLRGKTKTVLTTAKVDAEFLLAKRQYIAATGRVRGADDVIAYHDKLDRLEGICFMEKLITRKEAFLFLTMEELWRHLNMAGCFM